MERVLILTADSGEELLLVEGLREEVVRTRLDRVDANLCVVRREHDDR